MPQELKTFAETDHFNRDEFERQGRRNAKQREDFARQRQEQQVVSVDSRSGDHRHSEPPTQQPSPRNTGDQQIAARELATEMEKASAVSHALPESVLKKFAANVPDAMKAWVNMAAATAAQMPRSTSGQDEPVYELTRHQLATMIDGNMRYLMYQRDLEEWYQRKIASGSFDIRLEQYAFRSAMYDQEMARLTRAVKMAAEKVAVPRIESPTITGSNNGSKRPKLIQANTLNPDALVVRIKVNNMGRVAVWDRGDGLYELEENKRNVGAGLSVMKNGSCVDLLGVPALASTVSLDFGDHSVQLTIGPHYILIGERHLVNETGITELPGRQQRDTDWQLQFLERSGSQSFGIRYKTRKFKVVLDEAGAHVTM